MIYKHFSISFSCAAILISTQKQFYLSCFDFHVALICIHSHKSGIYIMRIFDHAMESAQDNLHDVLTGGMKKEKKNCANSRFFL